MSIATTATPQDHNPLHFNDEFVRRQGKFRAPVVHGILLAGLFSTIAGTKLPGPGSIYLSQQMIFVKPAYLGDTVTATITLSDAGRKRNVMIFDTVVKNEISGEVLVTGSASVYHPKVLSFPSRSIQDQFIC